MTNEKLQKAKVLEGLINYHDGQKKDLTDKAKRVQQYINGGHIRDNSEYLQNVHANLTKCEAKEKDDITNIVFSTISLGNGSQVGVGYVNIRPKALISYMQTEAWYHYHEAEKYKRELNRL